jgi:hypothetical protein
MGDDDAWIAVCRERGIVSAADLGMPTLKPIAPLDSATCAWLDAKMARRARMRAAHV